MGRCFTISRRRGAVPAFVMVVLSLGFLAGWLSMAEANDGRTYLLRLAFHRPEADVYSEGIREFARRVEERTGGNVTFRIYYAESLVAATQAFHAVSQGVAEMGYTAASYISGRYRDLSPFEVLYAFDPYRVLEIDTEVRPILDQIYEPQGVKYLFPMAAGASPTVCGRKHITTPDDWQGVSLRTAGRWMSATAQAWGAAPVTLPIGELYTALERRTVDCVLLVYSGVDSFKLYEPAPYITMHNFSVNWGSVFINLDVWNELPPAYQDALLQSGREAAEWILQRIKESDESIPAAWAERGMARIYKPSPELVAWMVNRMETTVWQELRSHVGPLGLQLMAILERYRPQ